MLEPKLWTSLEIYQFSTHVHFLFHDPTLVPTCLFWSWTCGRPSVFHELDILMDTGQACCRMSFSLCLSAVFSWLGWGCAFGPGDHTSDVVPSVLLIRGYMTSVFLITDDVNLDPHSPCPISLWFKLFLCVERGENINTEYSAGLIGWHHLSLGLTSYLKCAL